MFSWQTKSSALENRGSISLFRREGRFAPDQYHEDSVSPWAEIEQVASNPLYKFGRGKSLSLGSSPWCRTTCATSIWVGFHIIPVGLGEQRQGGGHEVRCAVAESFSSDLGASCLLPALITLWQATLITCKTVSILDCVELLDHPDAQMNSIFLTLVHSLLRYHFPKGLFLIAPFNIVPCVLPIPLPALSVLSAIIIT